MSVSGVNTFFQKFFGKGTASLGKWRGELPRAFAVGWNPGTFAEASQSSALHVSRIVPLQHIEFVLIRPIFCATHVAVANWIVYNVVPLLCVGLGSAQLAVPKLPLPNRSLSAVRPRSRDVISPILDPILQRVRGKRVRGTEQMDVIRHDHATTDTPEPRCLPRLND